MTTTTNPYVQYTAAASQTVFTFNWEFYATSQIVVYYTPAGLTGNDIADLLGSGTYSVSAPAQTGGTVTLVTPASAGDIVTIVRNMALTSVATFNDGFFDASMLNQSFDNVIYMIQNLQYTVYNNSLTYNYSTNSPPINNPIDTKLPQLEANQIWVMNATRTGLVAVDVPNGVFGAGTVTNIDTGQGLTGGPITETGTISLSAHGVTIANIAAGSANTLGGWGNSGSYQAITLGSGLTINAGGQLNVSAGGSGTVTSVAAGNGLAGGTITTAGTLSIAPSTAQSGQALLAGYSTSNTFLPAGIIVGGGLALTQAAGVYTLASTASSGAFVKIQTQTASNSASIVFTGLTNAYSKYVLIFKGVSTSVGVNGSFLEMQVSINGGSSYVTTNDYVQNLGNSALSTYAVITEDLGGAIGAFALTGLSFPLTTAYSGTIQAQGTFDFYGAGVTGSNFGVIGSMGYVGNSGSSGSPIFSLIKSDIQASTVSTTNVNTIKIFMTNSANIATGTFELCGIVA